jgi:hypothetical protein
VESAPIGYESRTDAISRSHGGKAMATFVEDLVDAVFREISDQLKSQCLDS